MNSDISWVHKDAELGAFAAENAKTGGTLLFGRKTYELMAGYPTSPAFLLTWTCSWASGNCSNETPG